MNAASMEFGVYHFFASFNEHKTICVRVSFQANPPVKHSVESIHKVQVSEASHPGFRYLTSTKSQLLDVWAKSNLGRIWAD